MMLKWMERTESRLERQEESLQAICNHWLPAILSAAAGRQDHATTAGHQQPPLQKSAEQPPPPPQSSYAGGPCEAAKRRRAGKHRLSLKRAAEQPVQMPMEQPERTAAGPEHGGSGGTRALSELPAAGPEPPESGGIGAARASSEYPAAEQPVAVLLSRGQSSSPSG